MKHLLFYWTIFVVVILIDINDLIRGYWFFSSVWGILFWNLFGLSCLFVIIMEYKERRRKKEVKMKELLKTNIKRAKGKLYFCGTSKDGYLVVCSTEMRKGKKKKAK